jgi:hypothetical protein
MFNFWRLGQLKKIFLVWMVFTGLFISALLKKLQLYEFLTNFWTLLQDPIHSHNPNFHIHLFSELILLFQNIICHQLWLFLVRWRRKYHERLLQDELEVETRHQSSKMRIKHIDQFSFLQSPFRLIFKWTVPWFSSKCGGFHFEFLLLVH